MFDSPFRSHVGLAIFNPPGFPTQWVLVLSATNTFQGRVLCSTVGMSVNGWQEIWMECESSPASFNRAATFAGVLYVEGLIHPVEAVHAAILSEGIISAMDTNPAYTDQYVMKALRRIGDRYFGTSSLLSREKDLYEAIRACVNILVRTPRTIPSFPVVTIPQGGLHFGTLKRN
jgi:hypothetical protein